MTHGFSTITLDNLITAALTGQPYNQVRLGNEARRYARRVSNAKAFDLPDDLHDEICQQAFVELFQKSAADLAKHGGKRLFRLAILSAVRTVRSNYTPAGQRTRPIKRQHGNSVDAGNIKQGSKLRIGTCGQISDARNTSSDLYDFPDSHAEARLKQVEDVIDMTRILATAPPEVAKALRLVHISGETMQSASIQLNLSRFTVSRRVTAFCSEWRKAA